MALDLREKRGEALAASERVEIWVAEDRRACVADIDCPVKEVEGFLGVAGYGSKTGQVVERGGQVRVLGAERRALNLVDAVEQSPRLVDIAELVLQVGEGGEVPCHFRVLAAETSFGDRQGSPEQSSRTFEVTAPT